ncbi:MAG: CoA-binding protein [Bacteroidota bacterium]|nr:CoA-binding protein [Bacteroidota bacterium]
MSKKTVVMGATENTQRYSNMAVKSLMRHDHDVVPVGLKAGEIDGVKILAGHPAIENVDTVTMYVGPKNQVPLYDYILSLKPKRIIFNPGSENEEFEKMAEDKGIEVVEACTLVMLSVGNY